MTAKPCARMWQVQAARDGRLLGKELANALRHIADCADCGREQRALSELARRLATVPAPTPDPLRQRRTRQAVLGAWDAHLVRSQEPEPASRSALLVAFAAASVLALAFGYWRRPPKAIAPEHPTAFFDVVAKPGTRWSTRTEGHVTRIAVQDGFAALTVRHPSGHRLLVDLPDGEIEDLGTVFQVEVREQHTVQVSVDQGRVLVRLKSRPGFELTAGQSWHAEPASKPAASPEPRTAITRPPSVNVARPRREPFAAQPKANSAEDDAYLHIVDLLRNGHELEARAKASQYLAQFPRGFRRPEVQSIVAH